MSVILIFLLIFSVFYFSEIFVKVIVKSSDISYKTVFILLQLLYLKIIKDYNGKKQIRMERESPNPSANFIFFYPENRLHSKKILY